jgi:hypothetical protein
MKYIQMLVLTGMILSLVPARPTRQADVVQELIKLKQQWTRAEDTRDIKFLDGLLAEDFEAGTAQGDVINKEQLIKRIEAPERKIDEHSSDDIRVRVYENVAVMTDHTTIRGANNGKPFGGEFRFVRIFVKQGGRWQVVLAQATPLKSGSPTSQPQ